MSEAHHSIQSVARRTGLTPHVIRVWERRYKAVEPNRTGTNRRRYSEKEIERLQSLRRAIEAGHSIGAIAGLDNARLEELAAHAPAKSSAAVAATTTTPADVAQEFVQQCLAATRALDAAAFEDSLHRATLALGQHGLVAHVVGPLAEAIGELWREGTITAAHEHFATAAIRVFLGHAARSFSQPANAPHLVVTTPLGQLHELGAVMAAATAADLGWRVTYLGTSLPAAEIAGAARQHQARAVALSIVYPEDDVNLPAELRLLRKYLPKEMSLIVGGRAAGAYAEVLREIGASRSRSIGEFSEQLDALRQPAGQPAHS